MEKIFTIKNEKGLHAAPASVLVSTANRFKSDVRIKKDGEEINAKSILGVLFLGAPCGSKVTIIVSGPDEKEALVALGEVFETNRVFLKE